MRLPHDRADNNDNNGNNGNHGDDDADDLDREFPLGDGTADTSGTAICPYCGEENTIALDPGGGDSQEYVEDCQVCCQPWRVSIEYDADGAATINVYTQDD
jgi:hypothetical protein